MYKKKYIFIIPIKNASILASVIFLVDFPFKGSLQNTVWTNQKTSKSEMESFLCQMQGTSSVMLFYLKTQQFDMKIHKKHKYFNPLAPDTVIRMELEISVFLPLLGSFVSFIILKSVADDL